MYTLCIEQNKKMLGNLVRWIDAALSYAEQRKFEPDVFLSMRLAPDQFDLKRQLRVVADTAKLSAARLAGKEAPKHEDTETTLAELKARIQDVIGYLDTFTAADFEGAEERLILLPFMPGKAARGADYFESFSLPNLYFHITTSYALFRHAGVPLGKRDFLGHMPMQDAPA
ncbi:MAG: DUF1993 domain-containing protein, partial [Myxococcota bacterium]